MTATTSKRARRSATDEQSPPDAQRPMVPLPVAAATAALFGALSRLRGARIFHPDGIAYAGSMRVTRGYDGVELLERRKTYPIVVRFSRALGLREPLVDLLGVTVRVVDAYGSGEHQDFPLISSGQGPLGHYLLLPAPRGFFGHVYSSVLLYRFGSDLRLVGARPRNGLDAGFGTGALSQLEAVAGREPLRFELTLAAPGGRWEPAMAQLELDERLPADESERLRFNPWNSGGGIRPAGPFMGLRRSAYLGSQKGRGVA